ncbi:hypothetical protein LIER_04040 [Lithospermum erythrorhizon]|uniref:Uncharacterized protein n=1 Tax=Lithospermum erythrorhizon TaxID=34254 RepID=A0AAV3NY28_LITER
MSSHAIHSVALILYKTPESKFLLSEMSPCNRGRLLKTTHIKVNTMGRPSQEQKVNDDTVQPDATLNLSLPSDGKFVSQRSRPIPNQKEINGGHHISVKF